MAARTLPIDSGGNEGGRVAGGTQPGAPSRERPAALSEKWRGASPHAISPMDEIDSYWCRATSLWL